MRPDLGLVIEHEGLDGAITFLKNVGSGGIMLSKSETDAVAKLLEELKTKVEEK